jgi:hypothetical protein
LNRFFLPFFLIIFLIIGGNVFAAERACFIDSGRVLKHAEVSLGLKGDLLLTEVNVRLRKFAQAFEFDLIVQKAVWASPRINVTDTFLNFLDTNGQTPNTFLALAPKFAFVDSGRLTAAARRKGFSDQDIAVVHLNALIAKTAKDLNIDFVFHEAVFASRSIDLTDLIIRSL